MDKVTCWQHAPAHVFISNAAYIVTAGTLGKRHLFHGTERLRLLQTELFRAAEAYGWQLQAWAVFSNHYHFVAFAPADAATLKRMLQRLHSATARAVNVLDGAAGRQVWFEYWDTCLTSEASYYARLNYVQHNAVHHGVSGRAEDYEFCSAAWFQAHAPSEFRARVYASPYDRVDVHDDF
jgi:putative transposase